MIPAAGLLITAAALTVLAGAVPAPALMPAAVALVLATGGAWAVTAIAVRRIAITRSVTVREAREDEAIRLRFDVTGLAWLPVTLEVQTAAGGWRPLTARGESVDLVVGRRGPHRLGPSPARVRDALGIFERRLSAGRTESLLILPAPDHRFASSAAAGAPAGVDEPDGLRPYTPGTPLSRIHWPALARGAGMHARRLAPASAGLPLVVVDTDGDPGRGALDWTARAAAGCILQLVRTAAAACSCPATGPRPRSPATRSGAPCTAGSPCSSAARAPACRLRPARRSESPRRPSPRGRSGRRHISGRASRRPAGRREPTTGMGCRRRAARARGEHRRGVVGGARRLGDTGPGRGGASLACPRLTAPRANRDRRAAGVATRSGAARRCALARARTRGRARTARRHAAAAVLGRRAGRSGSVGARRRAAAARCRVDHGGGARAPVPRRGVLCRGRCVGRRRPARGRGRRRLAGSGGRGRWNAVAPLVADVPSRRLRRDDRRCAGFRHHRRSGRIAGALAGDAEPAWVRARAVPGAGHGAYVRADPGRARRLADARDPRERTGAVAYAGAGRVRRLHLARVQPGSVAPRARR